MYENEEYPVYRNGKHAEIVRRTKLIRDRANNCFVAAQGLERSLPGDPRFDVIRECLHGYFEGLSVLFTLEDEIDVATSELASEVGK